MTQYLDQVEKGQLTLLLPVIWQQDRPLALAQICVPTDSIDASLNQLAISLVVGWMLVVGVATALGVTATRRVLRPLDQVVATTGRIAADADQDPLVDRPRPLDAMGAHVEQHLIIDLIGGAPHLLSPADPLGL